MDWLSQAVLDAVRPTRAEAVPVGHRRWTTRMIEGNRQAELRARWRLIAGRRKIRLA